MTTEAMDEWARESGTEEPTSVLEPKCARTRRLTNLKLEDSQASSLRTSRAEARPLPPAVLLHKKAAAGLPAQQAPRAPREPARVSRGATSGGGRRSRRRARRPPGSPPSV